MVVFSLLSCVLVNMESGFVLLMTVVVRDWY